MKTVTRQFVVASLAFVIATGAALTQSQDPVVGTWELNVAKSSFSPGPAPKSETRIYQASGSAFKLTLKGIDDAGNTAIERVRSGNSWVIQVWVKQPQGWQVVATQLTTAAQ